MLVIAALAVTVFVVTALVSIPLVRTPRPGVEATPRPIDADAERGAELIDAYGCGACHMIPGVPRAEARVGPDLSDVASQHYIAGSLVNTPDALARWIRDPQDIEPGTAMPDLGVTLQESRAIAAYLYALE